MFENNPLNVGKDPRRPDRAPKATPEEVREIQEQLERLERLETGDDPTAKEYQRCLQAADWERRGERIPMGFGLRQK